MSATNKNKSGREWREVLFEVIFEADTPAGKWFDIVLIITILLSVMTVMLDSVSGIREKHGQLLSSAEWFFTILFTIEYILRLLCVGRPVRYAVSFFGIVDLLAILPTYMSLLLPSSRYLAVVRVLRVLRIFRVLKLGHHTKEAAMLRKALYASRRKILVFLFAVLTLVVIIGSLIYVIEAQKGDFTSIPRSVYWAVVTLTTVGYGDISPQTAPGQFLAAIVMILGYSIIAVPTGIVTAELSVAHKGQSNTQACPDCSAEGHDSDARYCKFCGAKL
ncbi:MAG: ion transporter [Planctomycetes bacterium B3_Pla]|nr:MAG: ion transporter [Planctomycetes bacterium B3_Pla]